METATTRVQTVMYTLHQLLPNSGQLFINLTKVYQSITLRVCEEFRVSLTLNIIISDYHTILLKV